APMNLVDGRDEPPWAPFGPPPGGNQDCSMPNRRPAESDRYTREPKGRIPASRGRKAGGQATRAHCWQPQSPWGRHLDLAIEGGAQKGHRLKIPRLHATTAKELLSLDRRRFIAGAAAAGAVLLGPATASAGMWEMLQWKKRYEACSNGNPIRCLRSPDCYNVLVAFIQAQLWTVWQGPPADSPHAIAGDIIHFIRHLDYPLQRGACLALLQIDYYAWRQTEHH